jgi:hypothetical protein
MRVERDPASTELVAAAAAAMVDTVVVIAAAVVVRAATVVDIAAVVVVAAVTAGKNSMATKNIKLEELDYLELTYILILNKN